MWNGMAARHVEIELRTIWSAILILSRDFFIILFLFYNITTIELDEMWTYSGPNELFQIEVKN